MLLRIPKFRVCDHLGSPIGNSKSILLLNYRLIIYDKIVCVFREKPTVISCYGALLKWA